MSSNTPLSPDPRRWAMEPAGKGQHVVFAPETNCYKCPIKHTSPGCNVACVDYIEHMIENVMLNGEVVRLDGALRMPPK